MRTIAQISDLHFGAHEPAMVERLHDAVVAAKPDLVVVSGDLTQRARTGQFRAADAFLRQLEGAGLALVVVPGNHDVPLYNLFRRLLFPLGAYCRIVARGRRAAFRDDEIAVLGLASAHGLTIKQGRLTRGQIARISEAFADAATDVVKLLVTHHPLVPLPGNKGGGTEPPLRGSERALAALGAAHVDMILAGHHHAASAQIGGPQLATDPRLMIIQAGTAMSYRRRGLPNSFNLLRITAGRLVVDEMTATDAPFTCTRSAAFARSADGWRAAAP